MLSHEDQLLPVVHKIWSPLKYVLINSDYLGKQHAFQLLIVLAHAAKDFIRARTLRQVLMIDCPINVNNCLFIELMQKLTTVCVKCLTPPFQALQQACFVLVPIMITHNNMLVPASPC